MFDVEYLGMVQNVIVFLYKSVCTVPASIEENGRKRRQNLQIDYDKVFIPRTKHDSHGKTRAGRMTALFFDAIPMLIRIRPAPTVYPTRPEKSRNL